ncbi:HYR domain-containing protein, partial [Staphylococcus aureus]|uniref:HYR domain-containing protein n=1 Tax=Staphylococcus aureus TaxID=1280 RepID=UPI00301C6215
ITCPADITINTDAGLCTSTSSNGTATGTDNCTSPTITNNAPASFSIGNTTVTWTSTDAAGNFVTCDQIVTVVDNENPTITCPADITINTDAGLCTSTSPIGTATG